MKWVAVIFLIIVQFSGNAQVSYSPVFKSQCTEQVVQDYVEVSDEEGNEYLQPDFFSGKLSLPNLGAYILTLPWEPPIHVTLSSDNQADTFYTASLLIPVCICSPPPTHYEFCSEIAEGYCVDYYAPGVIRREGTFKKGDPIDTVKTYYFSGELMEIHVPKKNGDQQVQFYKNGNKKRQFDGSNGFVDRSYFTDGQLQLESKYKNNRSRETEYFQNGQLKRKERERKGVSFSETGAKTQVIHRKRSYSYARMSSRVYYLKLKKWNDEGEVKFTLKFSRKDYTSPEYPQNLNDIELADMNELILYKDGKPRQKFVQTHHFVDSEWRYEVVNYSREKRKWVAVSKHETEILNGVLKRLD